MISIIIPAHNESAVITRALTAITDGAEPHELEVLVVCNGCTDNTAQIASRFGPPVLVLETGRPCKAAALNLGDRAARGFPRLYVDADVIITIHTVRALVERLRAGDVLAVSPISQPDLTGCSWLVKAFYEIRSRLPSSREGIGGSGVYALSKEGRNRFGAFPNLTADDGYVRLQFTPDERDTLKAVSSTVFPPRRMRDLIRIRARAHFGTYQLYRSFPDLRPNAGPRNHESLAALFKYARLWPKLCVYIYVTILARRRAASRYRAGNIGWERDDTSRATT